MIIARLWDGTLTKMKKQQEEIPDYILKKSNLSWDEVQLIEYIRSQPEELKEIINLLKKDGENK